MRRARITLRPFLLAALVAGAGTAWGQQRGNDPRIGYLYPAGGERGTVVLVTAGGQNLRGATDVYISGEGVSASVIRYYRPVKNIQKEQRDELQARLKELRDRWTGEPSRSEDGAAKSAKGKTGVREDRPSGTGTPTTPQRRNRDRPESATETARMRPLEHPLLYNLEEKSPRELEHVARMIFFPRQKKQSNSQIDESVLIEIRLDPDAEPGDREIRLGTPSGLTNPMVFQVGTLPEVGELEPNDPGIFTKLPEAPPLSLPVVLNGQIMPGDVDRFRFQAERGRKIVVETQARHLVPYLADAVPGWFQAVVTLFDAKGEEVAFADDYRFDPDPVLFYEIPRDGIYELEIRDAIYRGREDFVYRVTVGEIPFITGMFPLGGREGEKTVATVSGWNLPATQLSLNTEPGGEPVRWASLGEDGRNSNRVPYAVESLPESAETEPNDTVEEAQWIRLPRIVNGRIGTPGDTDVFRFMGLADSEIVAEVYGRRLSSPLDSVLRLTDASGKVLEWNDDRESVNTGLLTHHADSYLRVRVPKDGVYFVSLADSEGHGGEGYGYRLRVSAPRPDFALRMSPSSISLRPGGAAPVTVHAVREDGFDGDIEISLKNAPAGFSLVGGKIPTGLNSVRATLIAPGEQADEPVRLGLVGRSEIDGRVVERPVVPSEDMMQAFSYRHLVPSQECLAAVEGPDRRSLPVTLASESPVRIPVGGTASVRLRTPRSPKQRDIFLELREPPGGVTLEDVSAVPGGLAFLLKADGEKVKAGPADNLIVEAFAEAPVGKPNDKGKREMRRFSLGVLPAIPLEIVQGGN